MTADLADKLSHMLKSGVAISEAAYQKANAYSNIFNGIFRGQKLEFLIYLCRSANSDHVITDVVYPKQTVSHAWVRADNDWSNIYAAGLIPISIFHSHNTIGAFQSPVDLETLAGFVQVVAHNNYIPIYDEKYLGNAVLEKQQSRDRAAKDVFIHTKINAKSINVITYMHDTETEDDIQRFYGLMQRSSIKYIINYISFGYSIVVDDYKKMAFALRLQYRCRSCGLSKLPDEVVSVLQPIVATLHNPSYNRKCEFDYAQGSLLLQTSDSNILKRVNTRNAAAIDYEKMRQEIISNTEVI